MSPPNEKKVPWIGRDTNGRLCLFRKRSKHYNSYKFYKYEREVIEASELEEYEVKSDSNCMDPTDPARRRVRKGKHKKDDHHPREHDRHDKPSPTSPAVPKPIPKRAPESPVLIPILVPTPRVESCRPRHRSPSRYFPCSPTFKLRDLLGHPRPASPEPAPVPKSPSPSPPPVPSPRSPKIYRVDDPHLKLEKVPVHKAHKVRPAHLDRIRLAGVRGHELDGLDINNLTLGQIQTEVERRRARCQDPKCDDSDDSDGEETRGRGGNPRAHVPRERSYSRHRATKEHFEEHGKWDEVLQAYVIKRVPGVRFL